jgi:uncharacterized protein (TIGR03435 family)
VKSILVFGFAFTPLVSAIGAQSGAPTPQFGIADVHKSAPSSNPAIEPFGKATYAPNRMKGGLARGGLYFLRTASMVDLIHTAYGVESDSVIGGPNWLDTDRFDVVAKVPPDTDNLTLNLMLQSLLTERFKLIVHSDIRPLPAYTISQGARLQMKESDGAGKSGCSPAPQSVRASLSIAQGDRAFTCANLTIETFAAAVRTMAASEIESFPVLDQTGLRGTWDFTLHWTPRDRRTSDAQSLSFSEAVEKQLGLKLRLQKAPMRVIVVDSVNRTPSPNAPDVAARLPVIGAQFEVAQVKLSTRNGPEGGGVLPGGRIDMLGNTMKDFIKFAWNIDDRDDDSLLGGPKWLDEDRFDIVAKVSTTQLPSGQLIDVDALRPLMKNLLIDRFKLKTHSSEEPIDVYAIERAKRGGRLIKADPARRTECRNTIESPAGAAETATLSRHFECHNVTMSQFAEMLRGLDNGYVDHPVIDSTGLAGAYDLAVSFSPRRAFRAGGRSNPDASPAPAAADPNGVVSLFEALDKQLGLQLKLRKHRMPVLVIDHVEQRPTEN